MKTPVAGILWAPGLYYTFITAISTSSLNTADSTLMMVIFHPSCFKKVVAACRRPSCVCVSYPLCDITKGSISNTIMFWKSHFLKKYSESKLEIEFWDPSSCPVKSKLKKKKKISSSPHSRNLELSRPFSPPWVPACLPLPDPGGQLLWHTDGWCGCSCQASRPPSYSRDLWPSAADGAYIRPGVTRGRPLAVKMKSAVLSACCLLSLLTLWAAGKTISFFAGTASFVAASGISSLWFFFWSQLQMSGGISF